MKFRNLALVGLLALCAQGSAWAHDYKAGDIEIDNVWARATAPGQSIGGGYLEIENEGKTADRLLSVQADVSESVEMHETRTTDGVSSMRGVQSVDIPAGGELKFAPGGYHIMFVKLKAPLKDGEEFPATLTFEKAGAVQVKFKVKPLTYKGSSSGSMGSMDSMGSMHMKH
jgi:copper(I)-binding protein